MIIKLLICKISCFSVNSQPLFLQVLSMMFNTSFMGMFVYMVEISSDDILKFGSYGMLGLSSSVQSSERCKHKGVACISLGHL